MPVFGIDITSQYDVHMQPAPTVVLKCIEAVESRGINHYYCHGVGVLAVFIYLSVA